MVEIIKIPGALSIGNGIADSIISKLVDGNRLPYDIYFRALGLPDDKRDEIVTGDVLAALELEKSGGKPNDYLFGPLPDCVWVPPSRPLLSILVEIEDDYHTLYDLSEVAKQQGQAEYHARRTWANMTARLNPGLFERIEAIRAPDQPRREHLTKDQAFYTSLGRVVIKDSAVYDIYQNHPSVYHSEKVSHNLLRHLLADNHPELSPID